MSKIMHRCAAWIACFAILLAALAPSISHALAAANKSASGWMEICSVDSSRLLKSDEGQAAPAGQGVHFDHCPFCSAPAGSAGLPPGVVLTLPVAIGNPVLPSLFYQAPRPLFIWASAQSRAPPALS